MQFADPVLIVLGLAAIADLVMLAVVLRIHGQRRGIMNGGATYLLLLVYLLASLGWMVVQVLYRLQTMRLIVGFDPFALARIALYFVLGMAVILYQLTRVFQRKKGTGWIGWLGGLVFLAGAVILYENPFLLPDTLGTLLLGGYVISRWLAAYAVLVVGWGAFMGWVLLVTYRNYRETLSPLHRNRTKYWSIAVCLAIVGEGFYLALMMIPSNILHLLAQGIDFPVGYVKQQFFIRLVGLAGTVNLVLILAVDGMEQRPPLHGIQPGGIIDLHLLGGIYS